MEPGCLLENGPVLRGTLSEGPLTSTSANMPHYDVLGVVGVIHDIAKGNQVPAEENHAYSNPGTQKVTCGQVILYPTMDIVIIKWVKGWGIHAEALAEFVSKIKMPKWTTFIITVRYIEQ